MEPTKHTGEHATEAHTTTTRYSFEVTPRPAELGGGWKLSLLQNGEEVGGGVFPASDSATDDAAYDDALAEGTSWLESQPVIFDNVSLRMEAAGKSLFRCLTCGLADPAACERVGCPERPELTLAPAAEVKCTACEWEGLLSATRMFGNVSEPCPDCGSATVSAKLEESVLGALSAIAITSADSNPQLTAAIVESLAPANADVLESAASKNTTPTRFAFTSGYVEFLPVVSQYRRFSVAENPPADVVDLTFRQLRKANVLRLPLFKNSRKQTAHTKPDGSDWCPAQWLQALVGELGEYARVRVQYELGVITREEFVREANKELADVQCYLDLLASRALDDVAPHNGYSAASLLQSFIADLGEYANARKKLERGDIDEHEFGHTGLVSLGRAIDRLETFIPMGATPRVIRADPHGVDLGQATAAKFNEVSARIGCGVFLHTEGEDASIAAIQFALETDDGLTFLRLWNEGEFDTLRKEWPEAPESIYIGADPLYKRVQP